ncbi:MAG TPA: glycosyltransferase family 2 protein [Longimicrobiales bacterium]|nr:glycosyltransferase family 2 protein [Longimicrobiales bacterium]
MIYVCIPAHDEAATVGVLMWKVRRVMGEFGRDYRIVVHDDASTDGTGDVLARYRRSLPLTILRSEERLGYARSVDRLLRHVVADAAYPKRDCAVVLQGDFTERPEDVVSLVKIIEGGADIVAGSVPVEAHLPKSMRRARRFAHLALGAVWKTAPVSDPVTGLRAYRVIVLKKALRDVPDDRPVVGSEGWAANLEFLRFLAPHARRISEVPLEMRYDLQVRPSRFRAVPTLLSLTRLRGGAPWRGPDAETA